MPDLSISADFLPPDLSEAAKQRAFQRMFAQGEDTDPTFKLNVTLFGKVAMVVCWYFDGSNEGYEDFKVAARLVRRVPALLGGAVREAERVRPVLPLGRAGFIPRPRRGLGRGALRRGPPSAAADGLRSDRGWRANTGSGIDGNAPAWPVCAGVKLTWKQTQSYSGWVKYVGKNPDGRARCFYLGRDRAEAELKALRLSAAYKAILRSGGDCWTEEAVRLALADPAKPPPRHWRPHSSHRRPHRRAPRSRTPQRSPTAD